MTCRRARRDVITKITSPFNRRRPRPISTTRPRGSFGTIPTFRLVITYVIPAAPLFRRGKFHFALPLSALFFPTYPYPRALPRAINKPSAKSFVENARYSAQLCERYRYLRSVVPGNSLIRDEIAKNSPVTSHFAYR